MKKPTAKRPAAKPMKKYAEGDEVSSTPVKRGWNGLPIEEKPTGPVKRGWNGLPIEEKPKPKPKPKPAAPSPITSLEGRGTKSTPNPIAARRDAVKKSAVENMGPPSPSRASLSAKKELAARNRGNEAMDRSKAAKSPVKSVATKGGNYTVYKKDSAKAAEFRKLFAGAKEGEVFDFDGRKYVKKTK